MKINKKYKVYRLNNVMGSSEHKALEEAQFDGYKANSFDTEEEAVEALVEDEKTWDEYIILPTVFIEEN